MSRGCQPEAPHSPMLSELWGYRSRHTSSTLVLANPQPEKLRHHIILTTPHSLNEVLREGERVEDVMGEKAANQWKKPLLQVPELHFREDEFQPARGPPRQSNHPEQCCNEKDHITRECPAAAPKLRKTQQLGNEPETAQWGDRGPRNPSSSIRWDSSCPDTGPVPQHKQFFHSALLRAGEQNVHPRVGRLGKAGSMLSGWAPLLIAGRHGCHHLTSVSRDVTGCEMGADQTPAEVSDWPEDGHEREKITEHGRRKPERPTGVLPNRHRWGLHCRPGPASMLGC